MWLAILRILISIAGSEIGKEAIRLGAQKLVKSTDNGIDNEVLGIFLDESVKSKRNKLTANVAQYITNKVI